MSWGVSHLLALLTGFCLDLLLGDPHWAPHPVRAVGVLIAALEKLLPRLFPCGTRATRCTRPSRPETCPARGTPCP